MSSRNKTLKELNLLIEIQSKKQELIGTMRSWRKAIPSSKDVLLRVMEAQLSQLDGLENKEVALAKLENEKHSKEVSTRGVIG